MERNYNNDNASQYSIVCSDVGRRPRSTCFAARHGAHEPERFPEEFGSGDWSDLGLSSAPWPLHLHARLDEDKLQERNAPLMYYPRLDREAMPADELMKVQSKPQPLISSTCYVILFGIEEHYETEGIYTLRTNDSLRGDDLIQADTVVAFETEIDAERFATLLEAVIPYAPTIFPISWADITQWCEENDTRLRLEASGSLLIPPETSIAGDSDWERALRLQRGEFQVLDYEPFNFEESNFEDLWRVGTPNGENEIAADDLDWAREYEKYNSTDKAEIDATESIVDNVLAHKGMDAVRLGLERLLPDSSK